MLFKFLIEIRLKKLVLLNPVLVKFFTGQCQGHLMRYFSLVV